MPFSEAIKRQVKERAAFKCCRCQKLGVQVHHIIAEEHGGPDTIDNAAPLCPNCHDAFGDNPKKRKEIGHMRDWWYEQVERMYSHSDLSMDFLDRMNTTIQTIQQKQETDMSELKAMLRGVADQMIENATPATAEVVASGIMDISTAASSVQIGDRVHANVVCNNCNTRIGLLIGSNECPNCKAPIR